MPVWASATETRDGSKKFKYWNSFKAAATLQIHGCGKSALRVAKGGRNTCKILILFNILLVEPGTNQKSPELIDTNMVSEIEA
jgi:hypothetical protein